MNLQHHLLIAMPTLEDAFFHHAVVYICEHNAEGAMGLVINKPKKDLSIREMLTRLDMDILPGTDSKKLDRQVFNGGPISDERGFILHTPADHYQSSLAVSTDTAVTASRDILESLANSSLPGETLVALGYCSWDEGQLEHEILDNTWLTVPATKQILFQTPPAERWHKAATLLGINIHTISAETGHC